MADDKPRERAMPPGLAYMVEHGHAADGSHADNREPTQDLVNPPAVNPTSDERVHAWVRQRARTDAQMQAAAHARLGSSDE